MSVLLTIWFVWSVAYCVARLIERYEKPRPVLREETFVWHGQEFVRWVEDDTR